MTPEQQLDIERRDRLYCERLDRYIAREGLVSVMNDTKWREVRQVLQDVLGFGPRFRMKGLREPEPPSGYWEGSFPYHVPPYKTIEWIEFQTTVHITKDGPLTGRYYTGQTSDYGDQVAEAFRSRGIPFDQSDGVIRLQGYTRRSKQAT